MATTKKSEASEPDKATTTKSSKESTSPKLHDERNRLDLAEERRKRKEEATTVDGTESAQTEEPPLGSETIHVPPATEEEKKGS